MAEKPRWAGVALLFAQEALGGAVFGLAIGLVAYNLLKRVDNYTVEVLITLALVTGDYALAQTLHISGPLAMVVAGAFYRQPGPPFCDEHAYAASTWTPLWEMTDEILNAVLFVLIGLEMVLVEYTPLSLLAAFLTIPLVLASRLLSVGVPISLIRLRRAFFALYGPNDGLGRLAGRHLGRARAFRYRAAPTATCSSP